MKLISRCSAFISVTFAVLASFVTWLVLSENSPLDNYFLYHVSGRNAVGRVVFLPYILTLILRPRFWADQISYLFIFIQWLVIGFVLSLFACKGNLRT
jgi:hypothetical protein